MWVLGHHTVVSADAHCLGERVGERDDGRYRSKWRAGSAGSELCYPLQTRPWRDKKDKAGSLEEGTQAAGDPGSILRFGVLCVCVYEHVTVWGEGWGKVPPCKGGLYPPSISCQPCLYSSRPAGLSQVQVCLSGTRGLFQHICPVSCITLVSSPLSLPP